MNIKEYLKVKDYTYLEYCDYLQEKYGVGLDDYMTESFSPKRKCKRTKEGLLAHHKKEDEMIMLSNKNIAMLCPFEWQKKEKIVYCDYLEHLLLHILICKYPSPDKPEGLEVGIGGIVDFLIPELNDLYSGWKTKQEWRKICHEKVINDKEVYFLLFEQFIDFILKDKQNNADEDDADLIIFLATKSMNSQFGTWDGEKNWSLAYEMISYMEERGFFTKYFNNLEITEE